MESSKLKVSSIVHVDIQNQKVYIGVQETSLALAGHVGNRNSSSLA